MLLLCTLHLFGRSDPFAIDHKSLCGPYGAMSESSSIPLRSICVYCASSAGKDPAFGTAALNLGAQIAQAGLTLVYGGGDKGLMGDVARGALNNGGKVVGIIPEFLVALEQPDGADDLDGVDLTVVPDMHTRKQMMFEKADAFIALPGGIGTLEELVEILTWAQLKRHSKPVALLNVNAFWSPFETMIDQMAAAGFLHNPAGAMPEIFTCPETLIKEWIRR